MITPIEFGYTYCPDKNLSGAQLIRNARIYEGLSLCDLSAICCITRQQLRNIETKIKFYMGVKGKTMKDADKQLAKLKKAMMALAEK